MRLLLCCTLLAAVSCLTAQAGASAAPPGPGESLEANCVAGSGFRIGGGEITLAYDTAALSLTLAQVCAWTVRAAIAVNTYFGRYPVRRVRIELEPQDGAGMRGGTTWGEGDKGRPLIRLRLGSVTGVEQLGDDWSMTHEMVHLSVPSVPERSHWLEEGIATYVEPIARVQTGELSAPRIWADMLHGMHKGLPKDGDRGLDNTPTWGRTYWGGALFCLVADVRIRERSGNRKGLQDALRGVLAAGGNIGVDSTVEYMLGLGDKAVGVPVLSELYSQWAGAPLPSSADLDTLWQRLGVFADGDGVRLDDSAPLAAVRRAITAPDPP